MRVTLTYTSDAVTLRAYDDGRGFDPASVNSDEGHWGIVSMQERAAQIEARFQLQSAPGAGTIVEVTASIDRFSPVGEPRADE